MEQSVAQIPVAEPLTDSGRTELVAHARLLARLGIAWHAVEAAVAIAAGAVAGSIALIGFGGDSLIESAAGLILLWRFADSRSASEAAERRAQRMIGVSFYVLAVYIAIEAARSLAGGQHPDLRRDRAVGGDADDDAAARRRQGTRG